VNRFAHDMDRWIGGSPWPMVLIMSVPGRVPDQADPHPCLRIDPEVRAVGDVEDGFAQARTRIDLFEKLVTT
jgi:hypothetical protein